MCRELKDLQSKVQKDKDVYKSQETETVDRLQKERQQVESLTFELTAAKEELDRANRRISELQKEFTDKQREFTDKLNQYIAGTYTKEVTFVLWFGGTSLDWSEIDDLSTR